MLNSMADVITLDDLEFQLPLDGAGGPAGTTFRAARREDWTQLQSCCYPDHEPSLLRVHFERSLEQQARGRGYWLVATVGEEIVGAGQLAPYGQRLEIANVAVNARWRRHGIGTAIVTFLHAQAGALGYESVDISVAADNACALRLYQRLGFGNCHYIRQGPLPAIVVLRAFTSI